MTTESENKKPVAAYCRACGKPLAEGEVRIAGGTVYCSEHVPAAAPPPGAGASPYTATSVPNPGVSPGLAFVLGLIPGVGAIYNGQYAKGLVHVLILGMLISIVSSSAGNGLEPLFGMMIGVFYFYMAFEAYHTARRRMMGEPVDEFSSLIQLKPDKGRFPVAPLLLIGLGVLFLLNNLDLVRLHDILRFWPVALIAAGAWMLYARLKPEQTEAGPEVKHE